MRLTNEKIARALLPVAAGAGCMMTLLITMNALAGFTHPAPRIGEMVAFTAAAEQPAEGGVRLTAQRPDQFGCDLDMNTLRHSGGSVVVENEVTRAPGSFRVHWAGEHTTVDIGNCGANADLIFDTHQLDVLAAAAGGYGAGPKRTLILLSENGI
jgi:hypothetical protein